jgi:hypothetical protein
VARIGATNMSSMGDLIGGIAAGRAQLVGVVMNDH